MAKRSRSRNQGAVAVVTIHGAGRMTAAGRRDVARWLRRQAEMLVREGSAYTEGRFRGRYIRAA